MSRAALWALLAGNFVIGTGVMVVPATLNNIAASLSVSVASAGQLIAAGALLMCLGAPLLAGLAGSIDRRRLLAATLLWYALWHLLCAVMPTLGTLMPARVLAMAAPALFTPQAAACAALLAPPQERGRAIALVFLGWGLASVLGMPLAAWVGGSLGWRAAFLMVAMLGVGGATALWRTLPAGLRPAALTRADWSRALSSPPLMLCVAVTLLSSAGQFVLFSYLAPYLEWRLQATATQLGLLFLGFGMSSVVGNLLMARYIDRLGPERSVALTIALMTLSLLLWPLGTGWVATALICLPWALGCFSSNSAQQARLAALAPALTGGSIALNTSAMYAGQAIGAATGGWLLSHGQMGHLSTAGVLALLTALATSGLATLAARTRHT